VTDSPTGRTLRYDGAAKRREQILAALKEHVFVSVVDLAHSLDVSGMTIRRDLRRLEESGEIRVVHGGASLLDHSGRSTFSLRSAVAKAAKNAIARHAVTLLKPRETIALDAGTTAFHVAAALPLEFNGLIVTHSVPVVNHLMNHPSRRLLCLGGEVLQSSHAFIGQTTIDAIQKLRIGTLFLSATAADPSGVYVEADIERPTKIALIRASSRVVLLLDHTKFQALAPVQLCSWEYIDEVITDAELPDDVTLACAEKSVTVTVAPHSAHSSPTAQKS